MVGQSRKLPWLLIAPAMAVLILVLALPLGCCLYTSFFDLSLRAAESRFIGPGNYLRLLSDPRFQGSWFKTLLFLATTLSLEFIVGLFLALMMKRLIKGRGMFRAAVMVPWAIPTVVSGMLWAWMFNDRLGLVNRFLLLLGCRQVAWLADPVLAWVAVVFAEVWKTAPFVALIMLAGLQMIPRELYEAAAIDGAGPFNCFVKITWPLLWPTMLLAMLFRTVDALRVFDLIMVMTGGGPGGATEVLSLYNYKVLFSNLEFGYGSAISMALFGMAAVLSLLYLKLMLRGYEK